MSAPEVCPSCGRIHEEDEGDFDRRADLMFEALDGATVEAEMALIVLAASRFLAGFEARDRRLARRDLIREVDAETKAIVIRGCDS